MIKTDIYRAKENFFDLVQSCIKKEAVIKISTGSDAAVMLSEAAYKMLIKNAPPQESVNKDLQALGGLGEFDLEDDD